MVQANWAHHFAEAVAGSFSWRRQTPRWRIVIDEQGTHLHPLTGRYIWPSEMDLMARLAGMQLRDRYAWWDRSPFTADSEAHVSVYPVCVGSIVSVQGAVVARADGNQRA